jgi:Ca2+-binding EF-hand superfamily protein
MKLPHLAQRLQAATTKVNPLETPSGLVYPTLPSLPSKVEMRIGGGLSRASSLAQSVAAVQPDSGVTLQPKIASRRRRNQVMPSSSFHPVCGPCGERFAETILERDLRCQPGPGEYGEPRGLGKPQMDSTHRSHRATTFARPVKPPSHGAPSHGARHRGTSRGSHGAAHTDAWSHASSRLHRRLVAHLKAVHTLASMWDINRDGLVNRRELQRGLLLFGVNMSEADLDVLFQLYDSNGDGGIDLNELSKAVEVGGLADMSKAAVEEDEKLNLQPASRRGRTKTLGSWQMRQVDGGQSVQEQLRSALTQQAVRVIDLFREWDTSSDGLVQLGEFQKGVKRLGYDGDPSVVADLFCSWDADGSGAISLVELNKILRRGGVVRLAQPHAADEQVIAQRLKTDQKRKQRGLASKLRKSLGKSTAELQPKQGGAALTSQQEVLLRKLSMKKDKLVNNLSALYDGFMSKKELSQALPVLGITVDTATVSDLFDTMDYQKSGKVPIDHLESAIHWACKSSSSNVIKVTFDESLPLHEQLRDALAGESSRVIDLFRSWDMNGDGEISRDEFRRAIPLLGISVPHGTEGIDSMFDAFDATGSGSISFRAFNKLLRRDAKSDEQRKLRNKPATGPELEIVTLASVRKDVARDVARLQVALEAADRKAAAEAHILRESY